MAQLPTNIYERFATLYAGLGDDRLLTLAKDLHELDPVAQEALSAELKTRGLSGKPGAAPTPEIADEGEERRIPLTCAPTTWVFDTPAAASAAHYALGQEGIEATFHDPGRTLDLTAPTVTFIVEDPEKYRHIYQGAHSGELYNPNDVEQDFETPVCPECGDKDPLLVAVEPFNEWECSVCGNVWTESA